jgi:hypothetical protein
LKHIHNGAEWISKFKDFIHQHTEIELPKMWFPENREEVLDSVQ